MDVRLNAPIVAVDHRNVLSIQYLRGFAALLVVLYHIPTNRFGTLLSGRTDWGSWGVDVFFVISGFVMWRSSVASGPTPTTFMLNRMTRIYPLYWLALTVWILARFIVPDSLKNADITASSLIHSYALLPSFHEVYQDFAWPILTQGWTMQLEMLFYALVAVALLVGSVRLRGILLVSALLGLVACGFLFRPTGAIAKTYTSPLLIEFAIGVVLGMAFPRLRSSPAATGVVLIAAGLLVLSGTGSFLPSVAAGIVAAALVVSGALILEVPLGRRPVKPLRMLGDASYSLYLTHTIVIATVATVWSRLRLDPDDLLPATMFSVVALAAAIAAALVIYRVVETPLLRASRNAIFSATADVP